MSTRFRLTCVLALLAGFAYAQSTNEIIDVYKRNFARSSLSAKYQMLEDAAARNDPAIVPLYDFAIDFVLSNAGLLGSDADMRSIVVLSIDVFMKYGYADSVDKLWRLFVEFKDSTIRVPVLRALGALAKGDAHIVVNLNSYLESQMTLYKTGLTPEYGVVDECVVTLGKIGDSSSFPVLFSVFVSGMSEKIVAHASASLSTIKGDFSSFLGEIIKKGSAGERNAALAIAMDNPGFSENAKAEIAEVALQAALEFTGADAGETRIMRELRFRAVRELTKRKWQRASALAVRNFREILNEYSRTLATRSNLLEAIALLGVMGTVEAGEELTRYLQLINAETEQGKVYDTQIAMAVIVNLGILGPKFAFEHLLYVRNLQYPEEIKAAAQDALEKIKW